MAGKTTSMNQIRQILHNRIKGVSKRQISKRLGLSRNTVKVYLRRLEGSGMSITELLALSDTELSILCYEDSDKAPPSDNRYAYLQSKLAAWEKELANAKVTRQLLWEEYKEEHPDGYSYSQFCYYLSEYLKQKQISAILHHNPSEKIMMDFAGSKMEYIDASSGEMVSCPVLVAVLPYSHMMYCEAFRTQGQADFAEGIANTFNYLGGVPQCILLDNMKTVVKRANRYEPKFTSFCEQLSVHYQTTFMAARVRKPKDKASVEGAVKIAYHRIYAKLRKQIFYSLEELNQGIRQALEQLNERPFKGKDYSRKDLFEAHERSGLGALPSYPFVVRKQVSAKVQRNYHIILGEDMHQYSVPYSYVGKQVQLVYTNQQVEIYYKLDRIAVHRRIRTRHAYTTDKNHLAPNHRAVYESRGWSAQYFEAQASKIGPHTKTMIQRLLQSKAFPEQTYNSCLGILRLANRYGESRLEKACEMTLPIPKVNYTIINNILKHNMDKKSDPDVEDFTTPAHQNLRGPSAFFKSIKTD